MLQRSDLDKFTKGINAISEQAKKRLAETLGAIDYSKPGWIKLVLDAMQTACGASADVTAILAAEFYDFVRLTETGEVFGALADSRRSEEATEKAVRGIVQAGVDGNFESMETQLLERLDFEVKKAAAETVFFNGRKDPKKPRFARVPSGSETCRFCIMLASRGFVYRNSTTAGELGHYHANCDCRIVPGFKGQKSAVGGYNHKKYRAQYKAMLKGYELESHYDLLERNGKVTKRLYKTAEYDYKAAGFGSPKKASKYAASGGGLSFSKFEDVKQYLYESTSRSDLESRAAKLIGLYGGGSEQVTSQSFKNAISHVEKRFK